MRVPFTARPACLEVVGEVLGELTRQRSHLGAATVQRGDVAIIEESGDHGLLAIRHGDVVVAPFQLPRAVGLGDLQRAACREVDDGRGEELRRARLDERSHLSGSELHGRDELDRRIIGEVVSLELLPGDVGSERRPELRLRVREQSAPAPPVEPADECNRETDEHRVEHIGGTDRRLGRADRDHRLRPREPDRERVVGREGGAAERGAVCRLRRVRTRSPRAFATLLAGRGARRAGRGHRVVDRVDRLLPGGDGVDREFGSAVVGALGHAAEVVVELICVRARDRGVGVADSDLHRVGSLVEAHGVGRAFRGRDHEIAHAVHADVVTQGDHAVDAVTRGGPEVLHDRLVHAHVTVAGDGGRNVERTRVLGGGGSPGAGAGRCGPVVDSSPAAGDSTNAATVLARSAAIATTTAAKTMNQRAGRRTGDSVADRDPSTGDPMRARPPSGRSSPLGPSAGTADGSAAKSTHADRPTRGRVGIRRGVEQSGSSSGS